MKEKIEVVTQSAIRIINEEGKVIYFDPFKLAKNFANDADYIFITHPHFDHFSPEDINDIKTDSTIIIAPEELEKQIEEIGFKDENIILVSPNRNYMLEGLEFETVPAYNLNKSFHKKEYGWVGYIVVIDDKRVYVAGDTDNIIELQDIDCDIAFVPIGGTYTMTWMEATELIKKIKPQIAIPIHYGSIVGTKQDAINFKNELENIVNVEIIMK